MFILIVVVILLISLLIYEYILKNWNYFSKQNVKFIRGIPLLGTHYEMMFGQKSRIECFQENYRQYPNERFIGIYDFANCPVYLIRDPALIYQIANTDNDCFAMRRFTMESSADPLSSRILFLSSGHRWRVLRTLASQAFTGNRMKRMFNLAVDVVRERCEDLRQMHTNGLEAEMRDLLKRILGDSIASCAFGLDVNSIKDEENYFYKLGTELANFKGLRGLVFMGYAAFPKLMNFLRIPICNKSVRDDYYNVTRQIFRERTSSGLVRHDFIDVLIEAQTGKERISGEPVLDLNRKYQFTEDDLIAQPFSFFFGGFSSLSHSLGFALHEIALNASIQDKLYAEVLDIHRKLDGQPLQFDEINNLKYAECIANECLRKWPVALVTDRCATKPYILENWNGDKVQLKPGDAIWFLLDAIAMDEKYFPNPTEFDPDRFADENKHKIPAHCFLPFGSGPRNCVAQRFAIVQFKAMLFYIVLNFKVMPCTKTQNPMQLVKRSAFVEPEHGFWLQLIPR